MQHLNGIVTSNSSTEVQQKYQQASAEALIDILGDTPPKLEVDFATDEHRAVAPKRLTTSIKLDIDLVSCLQTYCRNQGVSMFSLALSAYHHSMQAYSHEAFAIGVAYDARPHQFLDSVGMFVNTVLFPFKGGKDGGMETVKDVHQRWTREILPHASTPYDMVSSKGYGCNVCMAFNVGLDGEQGGSASEESTRSYRMVDLEEGQVSQSIKCLCNQEEYVHIIGFLIFICALQRLICLMKHFNQKLT